MKVSLLIDKLIRLPKNIGQLNYIKQITFQNICRMSQEYIILPIA